MYYSSNDHHRRFCSQVFDKNIWLATMSRSAWLIRLLASLLSLPTMLCSKDLLMPLLEPKKLLIELPKSAHMTKRTPLSHSISLSLSHTLSLSFSLSLYLSSKHSEVVALAHLRDGQRTNCHGKLPFTLRHSVLTFFRLLWNISTVSWTLSRG